MPTLQETFMARCIHLAKLGKGNVAPNPMVGSVIVHNNQIIGEGYHQKFGEAHAEVNAINAVVDQSRLKDATIYVNLEPCAHFGKTPPCSNLIIEKGIKKVVIGCIDPYSEVAGKGVEKLRNAGIAVTIDILKEEAEDLNRRFFTFHSEKRPYIILKWAQSRNGMIDINREENTKGVHWITQPETKTIVHKWRAEEAGILVGRKTVENDNPSLTCRAYIGNNPIRIVIDKDAKLSTEEKKIGNDEANTFILTENKNEVAERNTWIAVQPFSINHILTKIHQLNIQSVIIEGGKYTLQQFINSELWDEARVLRGVNSISEGVAAPELKGTIIKEFKFGKDSISIYRP